MASATGPFSAFESPTFEKDVSIKVDDDIGAASISPSGRDVVLASKSGLRIIDLDNPYNVPRFIRHSSQYDVMDVQWSPFASRADWIASTWNNKAIIYNLAAAPPPGTNRVPVEYTLAHHGSAITDINFSAHHPDVLATCAVDSYIYTWDVRVAQRAAGAFHATVNNPTVRFAQWSAGGTQVKWNRKDENILASSHDRYLLVWDKRHGAVPLTTVDAHTTKIYGIDWDRYDPTKILTCSLDKTIKLWDEIGITRNIEQPSRVIRTDYPIWRARHTPFPNGILAMPKRGSAALHLYTQTARSAEDDVKKTNPAHSFKAHDDNAQVQEFLWRSRGSIDDGIDSREFQLVSWGTDRYLHLYSIKPDLLSRTVGFEKGSEVSEEPCLTRKGAKYDMTYRDGPLLPPNASQQTPASGPPPQMGTLSSLFQNSTWPEHKANARLRQLYAEATMTSSPVRHNASRVVSSISWMDGVTVGERGLDVDDPKAQHTNADHDLAAEISHVGSKYGRVTFEHMKLSDRRVTVSFKGPWGDEDTSARRIGEKQLVYIRLTIKFPLGYPKVFKLPDREDMEVYNPIEVEVEKTMTATNEETLRKLKDDLNAIALQHAVRGREAFEAVICYALGERGLAESLTMSRERSQSHCTPDSEKAGGESSSEDDLNDADGGLELTDILASSHSNANVPLPIQCTARFSGHGSLVLVRMPPAVPSHPVLATPFRLSGLPRPGSRRRRLGPPKEGVFSSLKLLSTNHGHESADGSASNSSTGSWDSSSPSSSSGSDNETGAPQGRFQPPLAWQKTTVRYDTKTSHTSSLGASKPNKTRSQVTILGPSIEEFVPSKRDLAKGYKIFGDGPQVCAHNADVARSLGYDDLADVWELCKLILNNEVPLEILPQQHRREQVLVLARRALVRIKRKDSGLDLQFDEADTVTNPKLKGRIKWGHHSVVTWLIPALFEHYERMADTQMLAMLSCIFSEPAAREGVTSAMARMKQSNLHMSMEAPAFSLDYFPSADVAWSLFKPTISIPSTPAHSRYATPVNEFGWHRLTRTHGTYGSHGSSNGPWGSDTLPSEPVTPYSTGNTPPNLSRAPTIRSVTTSHTPYSTSPEQSQTAKKSSSTNFASAIASFSRPFSNALSSSPPVKTRTDDLSTSAPTGGVTWGTTTFYSSGSNERTLGASRTKPGKRTSFGQADRANVDYYSDSDSEYDAAGLTLDGASEHTTPLTPREDDEDPRGKIRVTLKNQDKFDDEACASVPLLDLGKEQLYKAWREQYAEMLGFWGLVSQRAEVLKFNGLISYFPPGDPRGGSKAGSMCLALNESDENNSGPTYRPLSGTSTLAPPHVPFGQFRRSPTASPRYFSFNPEATEFTPSSPFSPEIPTAPADNFISTEKYLRLSVPAPTKDQDEGIGGGMVFDGAAESRMSLKPHPSISRHNSNVSGRSIREATGKKGKKEAIYSCTICWIRVSGRFYLCPACGHVAHFECMDDGLAWEEGECVVGCGCGCGFEEDGERARMEEGFSNWEERGGWLPEVDDTGDDSGYGYEGVHGDGVGKWSEDVAEKSVEKAGEKLKGKR